MAKQVPEKERAPLLEEFTTMEKLVVALLVRGNTYAEAGLRLHISRETVKYHAQRAAFKIPGDMPAVCKMMFWARGATEDQMTGEGWLPLSPSRAEMYAERQRRKLERKARKRQKLAKAKVAKKAKVEEYPQI